ncbi:MAG: group III truncated hemoglobin [Cytophagales bacterium]|nr:group III truncated hemoglobin [Cytophagales bacterium]
MATIIFAVHARLFICVLWIPKLTAERLPSLAFHIVIATLLAVAFVLDRIEFSIYLSLTFMLLENRAEIEILVNRFYDKVKADTLLAPVFAHVDWPHHLPIMYNFWSSMMLGEQSYQGNPFQKHVALPFEGRPF